jgi:hypothetical protein
MTTRRLTVCALIGAWLVLSTPSFGQEISSPSVETPRVSELADFNRRIFYKNKVEFEFETGWLWFNTPLLLGPVLGDKFHRSRFVTDYTLNPYILGARWQLYDISGRSFWRGNTGVSLAGTGTVIAQGPETLFAAALAGVRYNFVQPNWRLVPYTELRVGMGFTDARQPNEKRLHERLVGQGQDFTFTFMMGAGVRYDFNERYSLSAGVNYMHISNMYMSEPRYYNHGINVMGPQVGLNVGLF